MGVDEQLPDLRMATRSLVRLLQQGCRPSLPLETRAQSSAAAALNTRLEEDMEAIRQAGTWKTERVLSTAQSVTVGIAGGSDAVLNFCSNNYLGLSNHPEVVEAGVAALRSHGAGVSSVRFICGTQNIHKQLEEKIARFHEREASILDGIRLTKSRKYRYKHKDMADLEKGLQESQDGRSRLIVTDGVFSMDGNVCPLPQIKELADRYGASIFIDECHATGFFGKTGRGTEEFFGMTGAVDIINSTLGKALGGAAGGYTCGSDQLIGLLRQRSRPYSFSNSLPPPVVGCASKVFDMLFESPELVNKIGSNTTRFRTAMTDAGFTVAGEEHAICPVMLWDEKLNQEMAKMMLAEGILVIPLSFPVVARGKARIRVQISAAHSDQEIDAAVAAFVKVGRQLGVVS